ncbi:MAG: hypothetical protein Q4P23_07750 [Micrococcaceae bacterium]|nr:hypothetical protein [Micrococcaceae bacterium]
MHQERIRVVLGIRLAPWLLGATALAAATAHVLTALGGQGVMAFLMGAMGLACLTCLPHLRATTHGIEKSALHLMLMSGAMALVHMLWIGLPGMEGHDHSATATAGEPDAHGAAMLGLIGLELLALMVAATVMRINRPVPASIFPAVASIAETTHTSPTNGAEHDQPDTEHLGRPGRRTADRRTRLHRRKPAGRGLRSQARNLQPH